MPFLRPYFNAGRVYAKYVLNVYGQDVALENGRSIRAVVKIGIRRDVEATSISTVGYFDVPEGGGIDDGYSGNVAIDEKVYAAKFSNLDIDTGWLRFDLERVA